MLRTIIAIALLSTCVAFAQVGAPTQPASGQPSQGTAAADAGKQTSNAGPAVNEGTQPKPLALPKDQPSTDSSEDPTVNPGGAYISDPYSPKLGKIPQKIVEDPTDTSDIMPVPPLPTDRATLVGGIVKSIDPVNDRMTVQPFGTKKKMKVFFDERSRISRNGKDASAIAIHAGDKIYLDTQLDKKRGKVFARNVRVQTKPLQADAHGQITYSDTGNGIITVHDDLSGQDVRFHLLPGATIDNQGHPGTVADLQAGALVTARFIAGQGNAGRNYVKAVTILAAPGSGYTLEGRVTHLDLRGHVLAVENQIDGKIYDLSYDPTKTPIGDIRVGSSVNVNARFDGSRYEAEQIMPAEGISIEDQEQAAKDEDKATDDSSAKKHKKEKKHKKDSDEDDVDLKDEPPAANPKL